MNFDFNNLLSRFKTILSRSYFTPRRPQFAHWTHQSLAEVSPDAYQWVNLLRIPAQSFHGISHSSKIYNSWNSGEILDNNEISHNSESTIHLERERLRNLKETETLAKSNVSRYFKQRT